MSVLDKIVAYEWDMLQKTNSRQKHLECRNNKYTFHLMRKSQWAIYPLDIQAKYLRDIHLALQDGRNLMVEKYAYMMQDFVAEEFEAIKDRLPSISPKKEELVKAILEQHFIWHDEAKRLLPKTMERGRCSCQTISNEVSIFVYLKGELYTYSEDTLEGILNYNQSLVAQGKNGIVETLKNYVIFK